MIGLPLPLLVFVAGGLGCLSRYGITQLAQRLGQDFPLGTLAANLLGCLAVGMLVPWLTGEHAISERLRVVLLVGFLGGFTTFSAFAGETVAMLQDSRWIAAGVNLLASNLGSLAMVFAGILLSSIAFNRPMP